MTNTQIKKAFKYSLIPLFLFLALFVIMVISCIFSSDNSTCSGELKLPPIFYASLVLPFVSVLVLRVYNLLVYGKFVVEEKQ